MKPAELRAVAVRLDLLRDIMIALVAAVPPDRAADFVATLGNRLNGRLCDMEIDECTDDAMASDLASVFAALNQRPIETQQTRRGAQHAGCLPKRTA